jgi:hypothetical protein
VARSVGLGPGDGALPLQRVWSPARWSAERSLRPITATARITQDLITRARRLRIMGIRRRRQLAILCRHLVMLSLAIPRRHPFMLSLAILRRHLSLAILSRRRAIPCRPALPLETHWPTARSVTGHITRKPGPISETTANVITAPERGLWEGPGLISPPPASQLLGLLRQTG